MSARPLVVLALVSASVLPGQQRPAPNVGEALARWAAAFDRGELDPRTDFEDDLGPYGATVQDGGVLLRYTHSAQRFSHAQMLDRLVDAAESDRGPESVLGLLELAGVGLERSPFDADVQHLRDLALYAAARVLADEPARIDVVRRAASGDDVTDWGPTAGARISALRLCGRADDGATRAVVVAALGDRDPRARLAAAEALHEIRQAESLGAIVDSVPTELHPVVSQALVQAVGAILDARADELPAEARDAAVAAVLAKLGAVGWRTDVEVVELVGRHPIRAAVPALIDLLEARGGGRLRARDREFAPVLAERAWSALRRVTGTLLPRDDPDAWRAFWARAGDDIEMRSRPLPGGEHRTTSGGFFGIEVRGRETAFVIDASKSMRKRVGPRSGEGPSRFELASRQLLALAQDMPRGWRFRVIAFADDVREWNAKSTRADARTMRALTAFLSETEPGGRSNLIDALARALQVDAQRFGVASDNPIDELFVLSDGLPTGADGAVDEASVLAWVREANRYQKIRIHAVLAGSGAGEAFLRQLAAENGGEFVQN